MLPSLPSMPRSFFFIFVVSFVLTIAGHRAQAEDDYTTPIRWIDGPPDDSEGDLQDTVIVEGFVVDPPSHDYFSSPRGRGGRGERGGGRFEPNRGDHVEVTDASEGDPDPCAASSASNPGGSGSNPKRANPIVLSTGNKVDTETDFAVAGGNMPLYLQRTYNHYWKYVGLFGKYWVSNFDYSLTWSTDQSEIFSQRPDGRRVRYIRQSPTSNRWNEDKASAISSITLLVGQYTLFDAETENVETYDGGGKIQKVKNNKQVSWTFSYTNDYLTTVTHSSGRSVIFTWTDSKLTKVTAPDSSQFTYAYTADAFGANANRLDQSATPSDVGNPAIITTYYYENASLPGALTGKAINGVRYSKFDYDASGRATLSQHYATTTTIVDKYVYSYSGVYSNPPNTIPNPGQPGSHCDPNTHFCPAPPIFSGSDPASAEQNAQRSQAEDSLIGANPTATTKTTETNPRGLVTIYMFVNGQLTEVDGAASANCAARSKTRNYDTSGYENEVYDFNGNKSDFDYFPNGQIQQLVEPSVGGVARTTTFTWDASPHNRMLTATTNNFRRVGYVYGVDNRLSRFAIRDLSPVGAMELHTWDYAYLVYASGITQQMKIDGPLAGTTDTVTYNYSTKGDLSAFTDSLGHITTYTLYNELGQPGMVTGPNGDTKTYAYYKGGRLKSITTYPDGATASTNALTYAAGLVATSTSHGVVTNYSYDGARRRTTQSRPQIGGTAFRKFTYDSGSGVTKVENYMGDPASGGVLHARAYATYDELGRVLTRSGNSGQLTRYVYDNNDNLKTVTVVTTPASLTTTMTYDALNRIQSRKDPAAGTTSFTYDQGGRVATVKDPRNLQTTYNNDGFGQLRSEVSPDRGMTTYTFGATGLLTSSLRANGVTTSFGYDSIGRLTSLAAGSLSQSFAYDTCANGKDRICTETANDAVVKYTYDLDGRVKSRVDTILQPTTTSYTTNYGYDTNGRPSTITYPNAEVATYTYTNDQASSLTLKIGSAAAATVVNGLTYEPFGASNGWTYGNTLDSSAVYDYDGRLKSLETDDGAIARQKLTYSYYDRDLINTITDGVDSSQNKSNNYDNLSRLTPSTGLTYTYDPNGNRKTISTGVVNTYATTSNRLTGTNEFAPSSVFTHDAAGNLTTYAVGTVEVVHYNYNALNRMATVDVDGNVKGWYWYNAKGERVSKRGINPSNVEQKSRFVYDESQRLLSERDDTAAVWQNYLWMGGRIVGFSRAGQMFYLHADHLGRPQLITNASRAVVWQSHNDAFGGGTATGSLTFRVGLPGQYYDEESNLYYNVNRYYNSYWGRYLQVDPIGLSGGINPYVYVGNNPLSNIDPAGLACFNFDEFVNYIDDHKFDPSAVAATLGATFGVGTMAKVPSELRGLGVAQSDLNPYTSQLSRWSGRLGIRSLREFGRSAAGMALSATATGATIFEGFYDLSIEVQAAVKATSLDDCGCQK